jgi:hypothetical protein
VPYNTHACQLKIENPQSHSQLRVSRKKLARRFEFFSAVFIAVP